MVAIHAEQMVFLDEALFNEIIGWRTTAWAPIGEAARYIGDRNRGYSWSLLAGYTVDGYLPCYEVKEGYYNKEEFLRWLEEDLLPCCEAYPVKNSVIVMDNAGSYIDDRIANIIRAHGLLVRYLPPYCPQYNPIELSWSVLKAWVRRRFHKLWPRFKGLFEDFLIIVI